MVTRRRVVFAVGAGAVAAPLEAFAQKPPAAVPHVGYLSQGSEGSRGTLLAAFRDGLRELGWIDGENLLIDVHWSPVQELAQGAASLAKRKPSAIVGTCIPSTRAAKNATSTVPVIMSVNGDPVEAGLVASLARPGANVTGTSTLFEELVPKWLEFLTAAVPTARTVAVMANPEATDDEYWWAQTQDAAKRVSVNVVRAEAKTPATLETAVSSAARQRAGGLVVMVDGFFLSQIQRIVTLASVHRLPAIYGFREYAEAGGLMSYGLSYREYYRGVARYVDKVLRGAKPADLPVQQPTKFELTVNQAAARGLGISFPQPLLLRADRVIQ
jgi:putative ABC transport system substrate-binding protein